jgi:hypothetical protein
MSASNPVRVVNELTVTPMAADGNPSEFSCAVVGAHISVSTATLANKYTATKPAGATGLLVQNTGTTALRFTLDGTDPTASVGFQLPAYQYPFVIPCPGAAIEFIRESAGGTLDAQWVR